MALTKDFKLTVKARADCDSEFRAALFQEAISLFLEGDVDTGKIIFRDYINVTIGFDNLALKIETPAPSLMKMFSLKGNPTAHKLFPIIRELQNETGIKVNLSVSA